ncbi:Phosphoglucomutase/phosphomannomutase [Haematococcus lacustris]
MQLSSTQARIARTDRRGSAQLDVVKGPKFRQAPRTQGSQPLVITRAGTDPSPALYSSIIKPVPVQVPKPRTGPIVGPDLVELTKRFKRLQNGSDIRGIAMEGVPTEPVTLTPGAVFFIGQGFARWLRQHRPPHTLQVAVGRDPRMSGPFLESALVAGLASEGVQVTRFGPATTPCMFCCTLPEVVALGEGVVMDAGIMLTASHMPWNANGLKFFMAGQGGLEKGDISDLLQRATQACAQQGVMLGEVCGEGAHVLQAALALSTMAPPALVTNAPWGLRNYAAHLRHLIIKGVASKDNPLFPLLGLRIVVDAGNGAGGFFATEVLAPLGADISGSVFLDGDGSFPNHIPNPEHPSAMASGAHAVLQAGADLGIVFDTDVDRSAIVDRTGREINSNRFIALMAAVVLREHPGATIVTDSVTSNGLAAFIAKLGGKHVRYRRGYKNVIGKGVQLNKEGVDAQLMMETSGHGAIKENYFLDDGAYLAVKVVIELVRRRLAGQGDVGDLLAALAEPLESREFRIRITQPDFKAVGAEVLSKFHAWVQSGAPGSSGESSSGWTLDEVNHEGWRVNVPEGGGKTGWLLLRQSLHDPLLVLNVESEVEGGVRASTLRVLDFLLHHCQDMSIDLAALKKIA